LILKVYTPSKLIITTTKIKYRLQHQLPLQSILKIYIFKLLKLLMPTTKVEIPFNINYRSIIKNTYFQLYLI